jgi:hypothetical protein
MMEQKMKEKSTKKPASVVLAGKNIIYIKNMAKFSTCFSTSMNLKSNKITNKI